MFSVQKRQAVSVCLFFAYLVLCAPQALSQVPTPSFYAPQSFLTSGEYFAAADFNRDGNLDVVVSAIEANTLQVFLGNGDGTLQPPVSFNAGLTTPVLLTGDVNGDGIPDIVASGVATNPEIVVLLGNGDGTFQNPITSNPANVTPSAAPTLGDFNGDGKLDLILPGQLAQANMWGFGLMLGNGDGTFQPAAIFGQSTSVAYLYVSGDFNADGKLDVASLGNADYINSVTIYLGNGDGSFGSASMTSLPPAQGDDVVAADFNHDGLLDLAFGGLQQPGSNIGPGVILLGNGDGTFAAPISVQTNGIGIVSSADVNGDSFPDLILSGSLNYSPGDPISVMLGNGDGTFQAPGLGFSNAYSLLATDFNNDWKVDLISSFSYTLTLIAGNGDGTFRVPPLINPQLPASQYAATPIAAGDFNGDGKPDLLEVGFEYESYTFDVLLNTGTGFSSPIVSPQTFGSPSANPVLADFNSDGKLDFVYGSAVLLGNGDGTFQPAVNYRITATAAGDINGDGKLDLIGNAGISSPLAIIYGNGDGTFGVPVNIPVNSGQYLGQLAVGDFNSDGKLDLAAPSTSGISIFLNQGNGNFSETDYTVSNGGYTLVNIVAGDFNGDGRLDLVTDNYLSLYVFLGNGDGSFQNPLTSSPVTPWGGPDLGAADFNLDGKLDLVTNTLSAAILSGNGDGTFQAPLFFQNGLASGQCCLSLPLVADFNGDSAPDMVAGSYLLLNTIKGSVPSPAVATIAPSSLSFGNQTVGTSSVSQTVTITNSGLLPLTFSSISISGTQASEFTQTNTCLSGLGASASCAVTITFTPTAPGPAAAMLEVSDNAAGSPQSVPLSGTGLSNGTVTLEPGSLTFSSQTVGTTSSPQTLTLTNGSASTVTISNIAIGGSSDFQQTNNCGTSLTASASCTISVSFTPAAAGPASGSLSVTDNASGSPQSASLSGNGVSNGAVTLAPGSLNFASQTVGTTSAPQIITLTNGSASTITISSIAIASSSDFQQTNNCGTSLASAASCSITITFTPGASGNASATLSVMDNASSSPQSATLSGTGVVTGTVAVTPASLTFSSQAVGVTSSPQTVTLTNQTVAPLSLTSVTMTGASAQSFHLTNNCGTSLAVNASCTLTVTFDAAGTGSFAASLTVTDSFGTQDVSLAGTAASPTFTLGASSGSSSASVAPGSTAAYNLSLTGSGFSGSVSLSCSGAPTGATCKVPSTVTVSSGSPAPFQVTVTTTAPTTATLTHPQRSSWFFALALLGVVLLPTTRTVRKNRKRVAGWLLPWLLLILIGCGGGSSTSTPSTPAGNSGTPAGQYSLMVTATATVNSQSVTQTLPLTLTVQ